MEEITKSKEYEKIAKELIKNIPSLYPISASGIKIAYVSSSGKNIKPKGKMVYADCNKVQAVCKPWCKYDFIIRVYEEAVIGLTRNQLKILLYHELLHVGIDDRTLEPKYIINSHDIEDFLEIVDTFGTHWADVGQVVPDIENIYGK